MPSAAPLLVLQQLGFQRGKGRRMHFDLQVDVQLAQPEVLGLFGPNGAGKSTLMDLIAGRLEPQSGSVQVLGHTLAKVRTDQRQRLVRHHPQPRSAIAPVPTARRSLGRRLLDLGLAARGALQDARRRDAPPGNPMVYVYDEPALAPPYGGLLFDRFVALRDQGHLVIFTVHPQEPWHLSLIRGVCDRYAFLQDGRLKFFEHFDDFRADADVADYLATPQPAAAPAQAQHPTRT